LGKTTRLEKRGWVVQTRVVEVEVMMGVRNARKWNRQGGTYKLVRHRNRLFLIRRAVTRFARSFLLHLGGHIGYF